MRFWNTLRNTLNRKPKSATEFIEKFIRDSKKSRVQLEIIKDNQIMLQVDSLRFTPGWFKVYEVDKVKYKNGFVIFFIIDRDGIETLERFINYRKSDLKLNELDEMHGKTSIRTFANFIVETDDAALVGKEIKQILDGIFKSSESNPQVLFNLRYIKSKNGVEQSI